MDPNAPSTEDLEGLMINKYLQSNGLRTKTRVDLDRSDGFKSIGSTLAAYGVPSNELKVITRAYFKEAGGANKVVTDNYIVGRIWKKDYGKVLAIRAHLRSGAGSSVFYKTCTAPNESAAETSTCDIDSSSIGTYFDSNGDHVTAAPAGVITAWNDVNFNPPSGDHFTSFFNSADTADTVATNYFNPDLFSPDNP